MQPHPSVTAPASLFALARCRYPPVMGKDDLPCRCRVWENSLYRFKAALRAARAADSAARPSLPLPLPLRPANTGRSAGAKGRNPRAESP